MSKPHYTERIETIVEMAVKEGLTNDTTLLYNVLSHRAKRVAARFGKIGSVAVGIYRFPKVIGEYDRNGDIVFVIVRGGAIVTVQLRRSNQVNSPSRLGVDCVWMEA